MTQSSMTPPPALPSMAVARPAELAAFCELIADLGGRPRALMLTGEAGGP